MAEYITREDIVSVGATTLTDLFDNAAPGDIQTPTSFINRIMYSGIARLDAEGSQLVGGVRLRGDAITGNPVISLGGYGAGGSGTGTSATVLTGLLELKTIIPVKQGKNMTIQGLVAGTAGDDINMAVCLEFTDRARSNRDTIYFTREDLIVIGATQLTDEYDDAAPPTFIVPPGFSKIVQIIVAAEIQEAAADDIATAALQFRGGAIGGTPTIPIASGGIGAINTGVGQETALPAQVLNVDIPITGGRDLQMWGLMAGEAGTLGNMSATAVLQ